MSSTSELEKANQIWERVDDTGYGRGVGGDKLKATQLFQKAYRGSNAEEHLPDLTGVVETVQPLLLPMEPAEHRQASQMAINKRLQPNGRYRRPWKKGVRSPIDYSVGMRDVNKNTWRLPR